MSVGRGTLKSDSSATFPLKRKSSAFHEILSSPWRRCRSPTRPKLCVSALRAVLKPGTYFDPSADTSNSLDKINSFFATLFHPRNSQLLQSQIDKPADGFGRD